MIDTRIEYIKSLGFVRDMIDDGSGWDRYIKVDGNKVTYIGHDKNKDELKWSKRGSFRTILRNPSNNEDYKLFRRKYIINKLLDGRT